ncbi:MAG: hypothetical protein ABSH20_00885 [Tepidisphaeraceae bacterium]|jgi:uncharacterized RDD family membrane protein YckC
MDITNVRILYIKGFLFLLIGVLSAAVILIDHPTLKLAGLLAVCIWSFARAYYFAFYVIEHYVDPGYRFAGLGSFLRYALKRGPKTGR